MTLEYENYIAIGTKYLVNSDINEIQNSQEILKEKNKQHHFLAKRWNTRSVSVTI